MNFPNCNIVLRFFYIPSHEARLVGVSLTAAFCDIFFKSIRSTESYEMISHGYQSTDIAQFISMNSDSVLEQVTIIFVCRWIKTSNQNTLYFIETQQPLSLCDGSCCSSYYSKSSLVILHRTLTGGQKINDFVPTISLPFTPLSDVRLVSFSNKKMTDLIRIIFH